MKRLALAAVIMLLALPVSAQEGPLARVHLGGLIKFTYTHRDRDSSSGVLGVDEAGLSWVEVDVTGEASKLTYRIELVSASSIYPGPFAGPSPAASPGGGELGTVGIRQAWIDYYPWGMDPPGEGGGASGFSVVRVGTFIPSWGAYPTRTVGQWDFIDLPLLDTHPAFRSLGWQNAGMELETRLGRDYLGLETWWPETVTWHLFAVNGWFPYGLANADGPKTGRGAANDLGLGARLTVGAGPVRIFGGYYYENFEEDLTGGPDLESYLATAWRAGFEVRSQSAWILAEGASLTVYEHQLMTDGTWSDRTSLGFHAGGGLMLGAGVELVGRWEWLDPNTADGDDTVDLSLYDQITQWTAGVTWHANDRTALKANYVLPVEQGDRVDVGAGREGGRFQERDNNHVRIALELAL